MYALDNNSGVVVMPEIKSQSFSPDEPRWFTEGGNGTAPSYPGADWFNIVQGELLNVVKSAGVMPDKNALNQLSIAIQSMINAANTSNVALKNILIGVPIPYPLATVPVGCLAFNGQAFSKTLYPELAKKYPSGRLPDLRGEFIRGWDNGRDVDSGRELLSLQNDEIKSHQHDVDIMIPKTTQISLNTGNNNSLVGFNSSASYGNFYNTSSGGTVGTHIRTVSPISKSGGGETRPRNIAYQYICLTA